MHIKRLYCQTFRYTSKQKLPEAYFNVLKGPIKHNFDYLVKHRIQRNWH